MINALTNLPSGDGNFQSKVKTATKEELEKALEIMDASPKGNLTRMLAIRRELVIREKMAEREASEPQLSMFSNNNEMECDDSVEEASEETPENTIPDNVVEFKAKENGKETVETKGEVVEESSIKALEEQNVSNGIDEFDSSTSTNIVSSDNPTQDSNSTPIVDSQFTAADVFVKLTAEKEKFPDGDSSYVIDKLINMALKDKNLTAAIMQPHKSYEKAFQYFYKKSREVGYTVGNCCYLDNDKAVDLAVEYFYFDEAKAEAERKAKEEELKKKREEAKKKKEKKPRKKKEKAEEKVEEKTEEKVEEKTEEKVEVDAKNEVDKDNSIESQELSKVPDIPMVQLSESIDGCDSANKEVQEVSDTKKEVQEVKCALEEIEEFPKPIMVEEYKSSDDGQFTFNFC